MGIDQARHFLARTGYAPTMAEILAYNKLTPKQRANKTLKGIQTQPTTLPDWAAKVPLFVVKRQAKRQMMMSAKMVGKNAKRAQNKKFNKAAKNRVRDLMYWWYQEMVQTKSPLTERLTFFWHDHFTTSARKVRSGVLLLQQNQLFRKHAAGNFKNLLHAIVQDPAMLVYLDNNTNRKGKPNENFARELLELFTLGEGNYTERDIKEAARALTGFMVDRYTGGFLFNKRRHDGGQKTFMGKKGAFTGTDIVNILLKNDRVAEHIVERLWIEFISETPNTKEVKRLAKIFRKDYEMKPLLLAMFTSPYFLDKSIYGGQIKSPVELIVGNLRLFKVPVTNPERVIRAGIRLGQTLFVPPSVKGWPSGTDWITADTLAQRQQLMHLIFRDMDNVPDVKAHGYKGLLGKTKRSPAQVIKYTQKLILPISPAYAIDTKGTYFNMLQDLALDPTFQLK